LPNPRLVKPSLTWKKKLGTEYHRHFPDVELTLGELTSQEQLGAFAEGQFDVGFARPLPPSGAKSFMRSLSINLVPLTWPDRIDSCAGTAIAAALIDIAEDLYLRLQKDGGLY
jgi:hypothetical protein